MTNINKIESYAAHHGFDIESIMKHANVKNAEDLTASDLREYEIGIGRGSEDDCGNSLTLEEHTAEIEAELASF